MSVERRDGVRACDDDDADGNNGQSIDEVDVDDEDDGRESVPYAVAGIVGQSAVCAVYVRVPRGRSVTAEHVRTLLSTIECW